MAANSSSSSSSPNLSFNNIEEEEAAYLASFQLVQMGALPMVLNAAVELDLFGIIARAGPSRQLSAKEIAGQLPMCRNPGAPAMVDRMLRLLATYSVVTCCSGEVEPTANGGGGGGSGGGGGGGGSGGGLERRYGLAPIAKFFAPHDNGESLGAFLAACVDPVIQAPWSKLKDAVLEGGIPFNMVYGVHAYEYPSLDPRFNEVANKAMLNYPTLIIRKILQQYKGFESIEQLVDVGGGLGHNIHAIVSKYPSIKGINFDLPHVINNAPPYPGVTHISGDMLQSVPKGDAIFIKWVLVAWSDEHCDKLLKNCYKALPENGKVIAVESIFPEVPENTVVSKAIAQMDALMMIKNPGGKERTLKEFESLAMAAGFSCIRVDCHVGQLSVMEFYK